MNNAADRSCAALIATLRFSPALLGALCACPASATPTAPDGYFVIQFDDGTSASCRTTPVSASFVGSTHRYSGGGDCTLSTHSASQDPALPPVDAQRAAARHRYDFDAQYDARTGRTTELLKFPVRQTDKYRTATVVELEMRCPVDVWLGPPLSWAWYPKEPWWNENACELIRLTTRGNLLSARGDSAIMQRGFLNSRPQWPYTSRTLYGDERLRLRDQLAQAEQAQRAARIADATIGPLRDASPTRQGSTTFNPAGSLQEASPTRQGSTNVAGSLRDASRGSAATTAAAGALTAPAPVPPAAAISLGRQPRIDLPNFNPVAPNLPAHVTAPTTSQAVPATTDTRGSPQRSGTPSDGPATRSTSAQGLPGSNVPPPPANVGLPDGFPSLPSGPVTVPAPSKSTTSNATAAVAPNNTVSRGSDVRTAIASDGPRARSTTTQAPGSTPAPPVPVPNVGWPSGWPQLPTGSTATRPPATPSSRSTSVALPAAMAASSVATTRSAPATALRIVAATPNGAVRQGQLRVQAALSAAGSSRDAEIEFARLSTESGASPPAGAANRVQWRVPMDQLAQGVAVSASAGPHSSGRWQMRVRAAGAAADAWSEPVTFDYVASDSNGKAWGRQANELARRSLNPQPLPPRDRARTYGAFER